MDSEGQPTIPQEEKMPVFETTWLQGVVEFETRKTPDGNVILLYVLGNGHKYAIPLGGRLLELTRQAVSPVAVVGADAIPLPRNGNGA